MADDILIQTRLPTGVGDWVARECVAEGISVAAYVRRLVLREHDRASTFAWSCPVERALEWCWQPPGVPPHYLLCRSYEFSSAEVAFRMRKPIEEGDPAPATVADLNDEAWYANPGGHRFVLSGSSRPWAIVRTLEVEPGGAVEIVLRMASES